MKKIYFPNLNGLRFIAALLVIIHHLEQFKSLLGLNNYWDNSFILIIGKLGVVLFFVLSGFLITYLLLAEKQNTNSISIKSFYIRRLLRIWPLYYLIIILGLFVFPFIPALNIGNLSSAVYNNIIPKTLLFVLFLPNLILVKYPPVPYASQSWSIGVEEQFYLIWPLIMKNIPKKEVVLYFIIFGYLFIKIFGFWLWEYFIGQSRVLTISREFWDHFNIDCMAIGGIFAIYLFHKRKIVKVLFKKYVQIISLGLLISLIVGGVWIPYVHYEFYAFLFGIVLINLATNKNSILRLENRVLNYLGKISYGLYMFHPLAIVVSLKTLTFIGTDNILLQFLLSILTTIIIASLSYTFLEQYFIKKKIKFSKILSGDNVHR